MYFINITKLTDYNKKFKFFGFYNNTFTNTISRLKIFHYNFVKLKQHLLNFKYFSNWKCLPISNNLEMKLCLMIPSNI